MSLDPEKVKQWLSGRQAEIAGAHRDGAGGFATCSALTASMDEVIRSTLHMMADGVRDRIAILALGGYGRGELCPHSDVDVMVLCPSGEDRDLIGQTAKSFLHLLWDVGLTVGHSVRTIDEAMQVRGEAIDAWASMVESRYVAGNESLADDLMASMKGAIGRGDESWFRKGVLEETRNRHAKYGNSVKLLEPNVKNSAGGLRDAHAMLWLYRSHDPTYFFRSTGAASQVGEFFSLLKTHRVIDADEHDAAIKAYEFVLRTRHAMHYLRTTAHDTLEYALQLEVAEDLGYGSKAELRSVEVFMHDYYVHARSLYRTHLRLTNLLRERLDEESGHPGDREKVGEIFCLRGEVLSLEEPADRWEGGHRVFEAFVSSAEVDADLDFRLRTAIERSAEAITPDARCDRALADMFRRILGSRRVARTLGDMNDLGILGKYIPEFGDLVAFFQHNVYHYYTADEHTLVAIGNAERLRDQQGVLREVFRNLKRKDVLYLAILLHDIGKPRGVGDHEVTGVEMARDILSRLGMQDMFDDVAFLIRNHLIMEQVAFRRNIHDPDTIKEFAGRFDRPEQLDSLYVLTYADLSAVNVNVWTEWKASMLQDLYMRTSEILRRNLRGSQIDEFHQTKREAEDVGIVDSLSLTLPREIVERHLQGMQSEAYTAIFSDREIARHIEKGETTDIVSTLFSHSEGYTDITFVARDAPFALSRFCAVLAANDANIFDANVFTRNDGIIIDRFRVSDATRKNELEPGVCRKITDDVSRVMAGELDVQHLFEAHHRRWKRRPKHPSNPHVQVGVEFEDNPHHTIIDVYAPDSVGFLYRVTETISRLGLDIYFAKIATRVDGIVDAFYVLDRSKKFVTDSGRRELIRAEIIQTIRGLQEHELA